MANIISWFDIPTTDFDRAVKFYSALLGEPIRVDTFMGQKLGFFPMEPGGLGGDLVPPMENSKPANGAGIRVHFEFGDHLDEAIARVEPAGGKLVSDKMSLGDNGVDIMIQDTEGNIVGLHGNK